ncbi:MAG: iron ABC transporter permease [Faecalibacterium prausnitzii]|jgi:iron complex transport system permease protein|nr:iron ABC transporter permease [Gemmiger sp.]MEE0792814.1 iron ABC transporter permease [Faecalibacterium prausnitzii]
MHTAKRLTIAYLSMAGALLALFALNLFWGSVALTPRAVAAALLGRGQDALAGSIVWQLRLPRAVMAALLGAALSAAGYLLQTFFANPIAGPFVMGISSGAKLAVALTMVVFLNRGLLTSSLTLILAAFAGALAAMAFVLAVARRVQRMSILVICGVMIGYICSAVTDIVVAFAQDSNIVNLHNWSMGSFSGVTWGNVEAAAAIVLPCLGAAFLLSKPMAAYQMGEAYARSVGVPVRAFSAALVLLSSLLAACVTAFAGPISFVGIAVPHLVRQALGSARPLYVLPGCALGGAAFCLLCDLIARSLFAPTELSISSVTAVFGAPIVIWLLVRRHSREGAV